MMRKLILLMLLLMLPLFAQAEGLTISPTEAGFAYDFTLEDEWVRLHYKGPNEKGIKTLYAPGGHFTGEIETRCGEGGKYTVTIRTWPCIAYQAPVRFFVRIRWRRAASGLSRRSILSARAMASSTVSSRL